MPKETSELKVHVSELALGMRVIRLDRPWLETDFLMQGFVIQDQSDIDDLVRQCEHVFVEATEISKKASAPQVKTEKKKAPERRVERRGLFARMPGKKKTPPPTARVISPIKTSGAPLSSGRPPAAQRIVRINKISTEKELTKARVTYSDAKTSVNTIMEGIRIGRTLDMNQSRKARQ